MKYRIAELNDGTFSVQLNDEDKNATDVKWQTIFQGLNLVDANAAMDGELAIMRGKKVKNVVRTESV